MWKARRLVCSRPPKVSDGGFFELRRDQVLPGDFSSYLAQHNRTAKERQNLLPGWLGMWNTALGGSVHTVRHLYHWESYEARDASGRAMDDHPMYLMNEPAMGGGGAEQDHLLPLPSLRAKLASSESVVMVEATQTLHNCGLMGAAGYTPPTVPAHAQSSVAWELRTYQLVLGYSTVPKFLSLYEPGLRDKLAADDSGASELATLLYSDCGSLNVVVELWRHESMQRAQDSRVASRAAIKWREAIGEIATLSTSFTTEYLRPLRASPWY